MIQRFGLFALFLFLCSATPLWAQPEQDATPSASAVETAPALAAPQETSDGPVFGPKTDSEEIKRRFDQAGPDTTINAPATLEETPPAANAPQPLSIPAIRTRSLDGNASAPSAANPPETPAATEAATVETISEPHPSAPASASTEVSEQAEPEATTEVKAATESESETATETKAPTESATPAEAKAPTNPTAPAATVTAEPETRRSEIPAAKPLQLFGYELPYYSLHPMVVHFPVVLLLLAPAVLFLGLVFYSEGVRDAGMTLAVLGFITAYLAAEVVHPHTITLPETVQHVLDRHDTFAHLTLLFSGAGVLLVGLHWLIRPLRRSLAIVALCFFLGSAMTVSLCGHYGAQLVQMHGVGVKGYGLQPHD